MVLLGTKLSLVFLGVFAICLMSQSAKSKRNHQNRLIHESSPYLLHHAGNPVDWYPWGDEAFERAAAEDKPVFLSIGYSTCHWCHVMEKESFEDPEVADLMNEAFISIKVDREERPDIDSIYMSVCQMLTGSGGWPLTVILTPDRKPLFAGTYFPKHSSYGRPGMMDLIPQIRKAWNNQRDEILTSAEKITAALKLQEKRTEGSLPGNVELESAYHHLNGEFDRRFGGFGSAPKFPTPHQLMFLLRYWHRTGEKQALYMVEKTLQNMFRGGIYDHIGYGFHRYSTDPVWLVPHFEKMLYDQALISIALIETYQATGRKMYRRAAEEVFEYVLRDMTDETGGFFSAEDADSEGVEGKYYVWTVDEIREILPEADSDYVIQQYNMSPGGNFEEGGPGANIIHLKPVDVLEEDPMSGDHSWNAIRATLYQHRKTRIPPFKDDKILTDWNGLMIAALALGARAFDNPRYLDAAEKAAAFCLNRMRNSNGLLYHRYRHGEAGILGTIDDYAFLIWGLIELYQAGFKPEYLGSALKLNQTCIEELWDKSTGGFFVSPDSGEKLIVRQKQIYDGAVPSGNSVAMMNLIKLSRITGQNKLGTMAAMTGKAFAENVSRYPSGFTHFLLAIDFISGDSCEIVIAGNTESQDTRNMIQTIQTRFLPNAVILFHPEDDAGQEICRYATFLHSYKSMHGKATAYICRNFTCQQPTTDIDKLVSSIPGGPGKKSVNE